MTKWLEHVKTVRQQHPDKTYKQILKLAKQSYGPAAAAAEPAPVLPVEGGAIIERRWNDQAQDIMGSWGDAQITAMEVRRAPVAKAVQTLLNVVSLGAYKAAIKASPYDKMFHLSSVLTLSKDGQTRRVILEKNEVVNLSFNIPTEKNTETMPVAIPTPFKSLSEYVDATIKQVGTGAFFLYDAKNRNCQRFIADNLRANGLMTPQLEAFVVQDANQIFKRIPGLDKFARAVTDLGAAVSHIKDEVVDTAQDVAKGAKIAARATAKQAKKVGRKIRKAFGGGLAEGRVLHTVLVPKSGGIAAARKRMADLGIPMPHGSRVQANFYRFRQIPPEQFDQDSFITLRLQEAPDIQVIMGRLLH